MLQIRQGADPAQYEVYAPEVDSAISVHKSAAEAARQLADLVLSLDTQPESALPLFGCVSFAELEDLQDAGAVTKESTLDEFLPLLLTNIREDEAIDDKAAAAQVVIDEYVARRGVHTKSPVKLENGMQFPASDYAWVPDPSRPRTWRLRLAETPNKVTVRQLVKAVADLTRGVGGDERLPDAVRTAIKRRIRQEFRLLRVDERAIPPQVKEVENDEPMDRPLMIWKDADTGLWQWMAIYSNNYIDDDHPREIITDQSHKTFVELVNTKQVSLPELWHWHIPGTRWGQATWVDYVDGFALAGGYVDPGHEEEAERLSKMANVRVSHGMPRSLVVYDPSDPRSIVFHVTAEISPLPGWAAANPLTGFTISKEARDMQLTDAKRAYLKSLGIGDDKIAQLEGDMSAHKDAAAAQGRESKERSEAPQADAKQEKSAEKPAGDKQADAKQEKSAESADTEAADTPATPDYVTRDELITAMGELLGPLMAQIGAVTSQVEEVGAQVKSLAKSDGERVAKAAAETPRASLAELIAANAIGNDAARIDGRSSLAKSGPKEKPADVPGVTGVSFLDQILASSQPAQGA